MKHVYKELLNRNKTKVRAIKFDKAIVNKLFDFD